MVFFEKKYQETLTSLIGRRRKHGHSRVFSFGKKAALAVYLLAASGPAYAQFPVQNPNWLCAQRLVQTLEPGSYWAGPAVPPHDDWRDNEAIFNLATEIVDRDTSDADALKKLAVYADGVPADQRAKAYPYLFGALVDQTNDQRQIIIQRIEKLGHRQNEMGQVISDLDNKVDAAPEGNPDRADLVGKRDFDIRVFRETQFTMRYACEAPANMERRLGQFARVLMSKLKAPAAKPESPSPH
jgi:hypothetical protein